jgi:hypothetical protein
LACGGSRIVPLSAARLVSRHVRKREQRPSELLNLGYSLCLEWEGSSRLAMSLEGYV